MRWRRRGGRPVAGALGVAVTLAAAVLATQPARAAVAVTLQADKPVYLVDQGGVAHVGIRLTTAGAAPTDGDVTVSYSTGGTLSIGTGTNVKTLPDTATSGTDYTAATGTVVFPAGAASGTVKTFDVQTLPTARPAEAKTIPSSSRRPAPTARDHDKSPPVVVINAHGLPYLNPALPIAAARRRPDVAHDARPTRSAR